MFIQQIPMIKQEHPPSQAEQIQKILTQLNLKSIEQILQSDHINVDFLAKTTNLHKTIVIKLLNQLKEYFNQPEQYAPINKYTISMKEVVSQWAEGSSSSPDLEKLKDLEAGSAQIIEIIGRANSGKSYFCFSFALHCLQKGLNVIFIDSNQNFQRFTKYLEYKVGSNKKLLKSYTNKIKSFQFKTLSQFAILIHSLGNVLIQQKAKISGSLLEQGVVTFIDCLSRIEMADPDTDEQNSTMDFDIIEKIKKLIVTYSTRVSTVVYTNRIPTATTLFNTLYKNQKHRPRCKNNNAKLWDSIANKTIFVDYSLTMENHEYKRLHFTKDLPNQIFTFEK